MLTCSFACVGDTCTSVYVQVSIHAWERVVYVREPLFVGAAHMMCASLQGDLLPTTGHALSGSSSLSPVLVPAW